MLYDFKWPSCESWSHQSHLLPAAKKSMGTKGVVSVFDGLAKSPTGEPQMDEEIRGDLWER